MGVRPTWASFCKWKWGHVGGELGKQVAGNGGAQISSSNFQLQVSS